MSDYPKTKFELRLSGDQRKALQDAADAKGMSLSSFLIEAAMKEREAELRASEGSQAGEATAGAKPMSRFNESLKKFYDSEDEATVRFAKQAVAALGNLQFRLAQLEEDDA
jgi:aspartokinase